MPEANVVRLIEYQEDRQRTPEEALEFLKEEIARGAVSKMLVVYRNSKDICYISASGSRDYSRASILWDITQWINYFTSDSD